MSVLHFLKKNSFVFALELYIFEAYIWWYYWYYLQIQPTQPLRKTKTLKTTRKGVEETAVKVPLPEGAEGGYPEKSRVRQLLKQAVQYKLLAFHVDLWWISCVCHRVVIWYLYKCCTDEMIYTFVHAMHAHVFHLLKISYLLFTFISIFSLLFIRWLW